MKLFLIQEFLAILNSTFIAFLLLLAITHILYLRFFSHLKPSIASGSIVMALSVFALASLRQLDFSPVFMLYVALEIIIIGVYLGVTLIQGLIDNEIQIKDPSDELAIGTWVAGVVFTLLLVNQVDKTLLGFIALLSMIAVSLFIYYAWIVIRWYALYFRKKMHLQVNGMIFLPTISIQAITLLFLEIFNDLIPNEVYVYIVLIGLAFYVLGLFCLSYYLWHARSRHLILSWFNENGLNYGALSITGLAMIYTELFSATTINLMWYLVLIMFITVESLDVARLYMRVMFKKLEQAIGVYHHSQWTRIFSFGIFYAFNKAYLDYVNTDNFIATYGQYVVAALLVAELIIVMHYSFVSRAKMASQQLQNMER